MVEGKVTAHGKSHLEEQQPRRGALAMFPKNPNSHSLGLALSALGGKEKCPSSESWLGARGQWGDTVAGIGTQLYTH